MTGSAVTSTAARVSLDRLVDDFDRAFETSQAEQSIDAVQYLVCRIGHEHFGYPVRHASGALRLAACVPIPACHAALVGITNARGRPLPVYSLHRLFGIGGPDGITAGLVVTARATAFELGFLVDDLLALVAMPRSAILRVEHGVEPAKRALLQGHFQYRDTSVFCLDIERICNELCGQHARHEGSRQ